MRGWDDVEQRFWTLRDGGETSGEGSVQYFGNEVGILEIGRLEEFDVGDMWSSEFTPFPVSQFTGLTDKNGVEIYEGDIVETGWQGDTKGEVVFAEAMFFVKSGDSTMYFNYPDRYEVIGNIYENPDLLEVKP